MKQMNFCAATGCPIRSRSGGVSSGLSRGMRAIWACLGAVGFLLTGERCLAQDVAQDPPVPPEYAGRIIHPSVSARLTLQPREIATGTRTDRAGWYDLDQLDARTVDSLGLGELRARPPQVYVPNQCVGTRRCPLLVMVGGVDPKWFAPMADKYGIILLITGGYPSLQDPWVRYLDAYLRQALQRLAIDPDKIAIQGHCGGGLEAFWFGRTNMHVFSRVISASPENYADVAELKNGTAEFLLIGSMDDPELQMYDFWLRFARRLHYDGLPVKQVLSLRHHQHRLEEFDLMGRWLRESWAKPGRSGRLERHAIAAADSLPLLTTEMVQRLTAFWSSFMQEPESVWVAGLLSPVPVKDSAADAKRAEIERQLKPLLQRAQVLEAALHPDSAAMEALRAEVYRLMHDIPQVQLTTPAFLPNPVARLKEVVLPVGQERVTVLISDFPALAAKYPSVAAKLQAAGLTAQQAERYRLALLSARATRHAAKVAPGLVGTVQPSSVLGRNVAFLEAHADALQELTRAEMWTTP